MLIVTLGAVVLGTITWWPQVAERGTVAEHALQAVIQRLMDRARVPGGSSVVLARSILHARS